MEKQRGSPLLKGSFLSEMILDSRKGSLCPLYRGLIFFITSSVSSLTNF
jgi:hypothetical protein